MSRNVISVGDLRDFPPPMWTARDHIRFDEDIRRGDKPAVVPATQPGELRFSHFERRTEGGVRSAGVDAWLSAHGIGRRRR